MKYQVHIYSKVKNLDNHNKGYICFTVLIPMRTMAGFSVSISREIKKASLLGINILFQTLKFLYNLNHLWCWVKPITYRMEVIFAVCKGSQIVQATFWTHSLYELDFILLTLKLVNRTTYSGQLKLKCVPHVKSATFIKLRCHR